MRLERCSYREMYSSEETTGSVERQTMFVVIPVWELKVQNVMFVRHASQFEQMLVIAVVVAIM